MSAALRLEEPLEDVLLDLNVELGSCYTMKSRGDWPWLVNRRGRLFVDLLAAADFWDAAGRRQVAARLRQRAQALHASIVTQRAVAASLREAVGQ